MIDKEDAKIFEEQNLIFSSYNNAFGFSAWVSPSGEVYWLPNKVGHLMYVCENPGIFDIKRDLIDKYLNADNSMIDIIAAQIHGELYRKGWIRIRNLYKQFFVTCNDTYQAVRVLKHWAEDVIMSGQLQDTTQVSVTGMDTSKSIDTSLSKLLESPKK